MTLSLLVSSTVVSGDVRSTMESGICSNPLRGSSFEAMAILQRIKKQYELTSVIELHDLVYPWFYYTAKQTKTCHSYNT